MTDRSQEIAERKAKRDAVLAESDQLMRQHDEHQSAWKAWLAETGLSTFRPESVLASNDLPPAEKQKAQAEIDKLHEHIRENQLKYEEQRRELMANSMRAQQGSHPAHKHHHQMI